MSCQEVNQQHDRRDGADQHGLGDTALRFAEIGNVTRHFAAAGGVSDVNRIAQIELFEDGGSIGGIVVEIMPLAHLLRPAVSATIMRDDPVAIEDEEEHLRVQSSEESGQPWWKTIGCASFGPSPCRRFRRRPWW